MLLYSISFLLGVGIIQQLPVLPELIVYLTLPVLLAVALYIRDGTIARALRCACMVMAGGLWATVSALQYLDSRLPEVLAGQDILIEGRVSGIPLQRGIIHRFVLEVDTFEPLDRQLHEVLNNIPGRLRISWYYPKVELRAGERWRLLVRLKPPHGVSNPAGFDYETWLYQQSIHATGYVRKSEHNQRLETASYLSVDATRQFIKEKVIQSLGDSEHSGLIVGLAVGDRSSISSRQWRDLIDTGTNHLVAISGLHIGLAAFFAYGFARWLIPSSVMRRCSAQQLSMCVALVFATLYALLAGFSIPTQRALIMLICIAVAVLLKRHHDPVNVLSVALLLVLLNDPVSVLSAGFWFSFLAVAVIFYLFKLHRREKQGTETETALFRYVKRLKQWGGLQLIFAFSLFPLSLLMFQQTSLIAPLANFLMVPFVSFFIVPLVLLSLFVLILYEPLAVSLLEIANWLISHIWPWLHFLASQPNSHWQHAVYSPWLVVMAMIGIAMLLSSFSRYIRLSGLLLVLPIFYNPAERPPPGGFEMLLLDVGQGLAVVIKTHNHTMIYDTGASFSEDLDSGKTVVLPNLRADGVRHLDKLIVSHGDNDHIGGADSILKAYPDTQLIGQDIESIDFENKVKCERGLSWLWDGVDFEFVHPDKTAYKKRNNRSCVLMVSSPGGKLLLTGDIEQKIERQLLLSDGDIRDIDVLVVPHHGSKTSSSKLWLAHLNPKISLFSVGYRNRYRLPATEIVERYEELSTREGTQLLSTVDSGAIRLLFQPIHGVQIKQRHRVDESKYWHHKPLNFNNKSRF